MNIILVNLLQDRCLTTFNIDFIVMAPWKSVEFFFFSTHRVVLSAKKSSLSMHEEFQKITGRVKCVMMTHTTVQKSHSVKVFRVCME